MNILSIDIGGTKFQVSVVSDSGRIFDSARCLTPKSLDAEVLFKALTDLISPMVDVHLIDVVGVGCGGPMSKGGDLVSPLNIPAWRGFPLKKRLRELVSCEVFVDNDAKAITLAELYFGAGSGLSDFMAMVVSTGVGGGVISDGRLIDGRSWNAGHIGHFTVVPDGHLCACGAQGCLEAEISGLSTQQILGIPANRAPSDWIRRSGELLARAVASSAAILDFERVFVGGSVALGYGALFFETANSALKSFARLDFLEKLEIVPTSLGTEFACLSGAAVALYRL